MLLREGQTLAGTTVKGFNVLANVTGGSGQTRSFNASRSVLVSVTFSDNAQSLVSVIVP